MNWAKITRNRGPTAEEFYEVVYVVKENRRTTYGVVRAEYGRETPAQMFAYEDGLVGGGLSEFDPEDHRRLLQHGAVEIDGGRVTLHLLPAVPQPDDDENAPTLADEIRRLREEPGFQALQNEAPVVFGMEAGRRFIDRGLMATWQRALETYGAVSMQRWLLTVFIREDGGVA
jgi:hypothetical protein